METCYLAYIDDEPAYDFFSRKIGEYNKQMRKRNDQFLKSVLDEIFESAELIESQGDDDLEFKSLLVQEGIEQFDKENLNKKFKKIFLRKKCKVLNLMQLCPVVDNKKFEPLAQTVELFNQKYFMIKDQKSKIKKSIFPLYFSLIIFPINFSLALEISPYNLKVQKNIIIKNANAL